MQMMELGTIRRLGQIEKPFPVLETVGGITGTGLVIGGVVVKGTPGTVMGILGGIALAGSLVAIIAKMASGTPAAATAPGAPAPYPAAPPPPPPPKPPSPPSYMKYADYATAFAPVINQLFTGLKLFGVRQPAMLVAHGRGR